MAGEIKSTLTLDVSKFASAIDRAIGGAESLEKHLKSAAKVAADFDKGIASVGSDLSNFAKNFRLLDQSVENMVSKLAGVVSRLDSLGQRTSNASKGVDQLGASIKKITSTKADEWIGNYAKELNKLAPAINDAIKSVLEFDRANTTSGEVAEKSASKTVAARLKVLEAEKQTNQKILSDRQRLANEIRAIQDRMERDAAVKRLEAGKYFGKNSGKGDALRAEADTLSGVGVAAGEQLPQLEILIKELKWKNAEIEKSIALIHQETAATDKKAAADKAAAAAVKAAKIAEREAAQAAKQAASESAAYARDAARERMRVAAEAAAFERQQAQQIAQMWKGMGQLWAASKIERGLSAGIGKASELQQTDMRVKLLNLPTAEYEEFKQKAFDVTKEEKYLSVMDAMQARLDALTAIGYNHKEAIDGTMSSALRNAQVMLSAGYEHGSRSDLIKNLYGFAESRQVMNDPTKVRESFDIARRMGVASGGKINIADMETVARNMGDLRQTMSADGWMGVAALMEQFKVAGSQGHGGAGAGVSSVGTMLKMMSLYAAGKPVTNVAAQQLLGADVMNDVFADGTAQNFQQGRENNSAFQRAVKTAGFKGVKEMSENPVDFFSGLRGNLMGYMKDDKNKGKFFEGGDTESPEAESAALKKFFAKMGMSNKTVDGMLTMMNKAFIERSNHVRQLAKDAADEEKAVDEMKETWKNAVDEMNAGAANLAAAFAPALKPLSEIPKAIGGILNKAAEFVKDNPLMGFADLALVAFGGLTLAVKGTLNTFGMVGGVFNSVRTIMSGGTTAVAAATSSWGTLRAMVLSVGLAFPKLTGIMDTVITVAARVGSALLAPFATVAGGAAGAIGWIGKLSTTLLGFIARWASPIGWAALAAQFGWVVGEWISTLKLGGISIGEHMQNIFLDIELGWKRMLLGIQEKWVDFKKLIGGNDFLGESAERKEIEAERAKLAQYEKDMRIVPTEPPKVAAPAGEKKEEKKEGGSTGKPTKVTDTSGLFAKEPRHVREFENSFQRSLEQMVGRQNIEGFKLGTIVSGQPSYDEQAKAAFMEKWLGGDFDDGKDPTKRKFVKDGKGYDKSKGWSADDLDWSATDKQTGKTIEQWLEAYKASKKLEDAIKGVTFATERAAAKEEEASTARERLTGDIIGQTDAMKALNKEFAREEARNPSVKDNKDYQDRKQSAITNQAIADYANMGANLVQKNKEMEAQFLTTERERLEAGVQATYEAKKREASLVVEQLDRQIEALKEAGKEGSQAWNDAIEARKQGEDEFTRYLKNIAEERKRALETPMQQMVREWGDVYGQLDKLGEQWANGFMDQLGNLITTGKADWRSFTASMLSDLAKVMLKKGFADMIGGPEGMGGLGLGGLAKKGMDWLFGAKAGGAGIKAPVPGVGAAPGLDGAAGGGLKAPTDGGIGSGIGGGLEDQAKQLGDSLGGVAESAEAASLAQEGMNAATEASTIATELNTTVTETDTVAVEGATVATTLDTVATEADTAATTVSATSEFVDAAANEFDATTEIANAAANEYDAATEYLANGGVADQFGLSFFANGGAFTNGIYSDPTLFKFANGGQFGVMGEAGPEAVMPLSRDGKGRLGVAVNEGGGAGSGGGDSTQVNISIVVNQDGSEGGSASATGSSDASDWRQMANRVKGVVREELAAQQRPGGLLYK